MKMDTTISITNENLLSIQDLADSFSISKTKVVSAIFIVAINKDNIVRVNRFSMEYQERGEVRMGKMHLYLDELDVDISQDLRRFYRASLSLLIAEVLHLYYEEIIALLSGTVNYPDRCHCKIYFPHNGMMCWKHFWGIPPIEEPRRE